MFVLALKAADLFFLFEEVNHTGCAEFTIDLRIRAAEASATKVILVFRTKINTFDLWMILAICHALFSAPP